MRSMRAFIWRRSVIWLAEPFDGARLCAYALEESVASKAKDNTAMTAAIQTETTPRAACIVPCEGWLHDVPGGQVCVEGTSGSGCAARVRLERVLEMAGIKRKGL